MSLHWIDLAIVVVYLVGITGIGVIAARRQTASSANYFLAGRSLGWVNIGLALFATNISTVHLIGLASSAYSDGMVIGNFEWLAPFLLILLGLVFAPFYFRNRVATLPEFLEGDEVQIAIVARDVASLRHAAAQLQAAADTPACAEMFALLGEAP